MASPVVVMASNAQSNQPDDDDTGALTIGVFNNRVTNLAKSEARGSSSRPGLGLAIVEAAKAGLVKLDDAPGIHQRYAKGIADAKGVGYVAMPSEDAQVSKLRSFIKLGHLPNVNGIAVMNATADVIRKMTAANNGKPVGGSPFDNMVKVAREQVAMQPNVAFTSDQIEAVLTPLGKDDPLEADRLDKLASAIEKMRTDDKNPLSDDTLTMLDEIQQPILDRIKALGGTTKQIKAAAKAEAKATAMGQNLVAYRASNNLPGHVVLAHTPAGLAEYSAGIATSKE